MENTTPQKKNVIDRITVFHITIESPVGPLHLYANEEALLGIYFDDNRARAQKRFAKCDLKKTKTNLLAKAEKQILEFLSGRRFEFDLPLLIEGTPFERKVWQSLCDIEYGSFISYSQQAEGIDLKRAVRAVASANGRNPFPLIYPCHRVLRADQSAGGYSGGLEWKKYLMEMEAASKGSARGCGVP